MNILLIALIALAGTGICTVKDIVVKNTFSTVNVMYLNEHTVQLYFFIFFICVFIISILCLLINTLGKVKT